MPFWAEHLTDPDPWLRINAGRALVDLRLTHGHLLGPATPALLVALTDDEADVRGNAVTTLGKLGTPHVDAAAALLSDPVAEVQEKACHALGRMKTPAAAHALATALEQGEETARAALRALGNMGEPALCVIDVLIEHALLGESLPRRASAAIAVRSIAGGRERALEKWDAALQHPKQRLAAARALAHVATVEDYSRIEPLLDDPMLRAETLAGLGRHRKPPPPFWSAIARCLEDADAGVRRRAARMLAHAARAGACVDVLRRLLEDADKAVQASAIAALGSIGDRPSLPQLLAMLEAGEQAEWILYALAGYHAQPEQVLPALIAATHDEEHAVPAISSLISLGGGGQAALPRLLALSCDEDTDVRDSALRALGRFPGEPAVVERLCRALASEEGLDRMSAAQGLGLLGPDAAEGAEALCRFITQHQATKADGEYVNGWENVLLAVGCTAAPAAVPVLCGLLAGPLNMHDEVRIIGALGRIGGSEARRALAEVTASDPPVRAALCVARLRQGERLSVPEQAAVLAWLAEDLDVTIRVYDESDELRHRVLLDDIVLVVSQAPAHEPALAAHLDAIGKQLRPLVGDVDFLSVAAAIEAVVSALP